MPLLAALALGLITAVSPCPLATNIAAVAYISKSIEDRRQTALSGILYTAGRVFTYVILGLGLVYLGINVVNVSGFLRNSSVYYLGPLLILVALVMLDVIKLHIFRGGLASRLGQRLSGKGLLGSFLLGALFALSFCPYSAILFFGMLIPLAISVPGGGIYLTATYAVGTGLPVLVIALLIAFGVEQWAKHVEKVQKFERYMRIFAALVFMGVGIYYVVILIKTVI
ncbi:MAG: hypothetical protein A2W01_04010 [Candidatus Solincola sediminis]|nr:MAG: hypothetical protein A2W01_04010 [Candidatus Solincola sediminis]